VSDIGDYVDSIQVIESVTWMLLFIESE